MSGIDREEFHHWMELLREDIGGVHARLDVLNGRTRTVETKVALLEVMPPGRDQAARVTSASAGLAALIAMVWQWLTR